MTPRTSQTHRRQDALPWRRIGARGRRLGVKLAAARPG
jgi:hypothetical protein